jgi:hypothetical protein
MCGIHADDGNSRFARFQAFPLNVYAYVHASFLGLRFFRCSSDDVTALSIGKAIDRAGAHKQLAAADHTHICIDESANLPRIIL